MPSLFGMLGLGARRCSLCVLLGTTLLAGCSDDSSGNNPSSNGGGASGGSGSQGENPSVIGDCPTTTTLIETTDWPDCLSGAKLSGVEPFSGESCALRIGDDAAFTYEVDGSEVISVPPRSEWTDSSGTYQNEGEGSRLIFLAGISPDLPVVEGEARVTRINISIFGLESKDDMVEISYLDEKLSSQTYNCKLD
jgi:hypothetical protein